MVLATKSQARIRGRWNIRGTADGTTSGSGQARGATCAMTRAGRRWRASGADLEFGNTAAYKSS